MEPCIVRLVVNDAIHVWKYLFNNIPKICCRAHRMYINISQIDVIVFPMAQMSVPA